MSNLKLTEELQNQIITFYKSKPMGYKEVQEKFHLSLPTISKVLKNIDKYSKSKIFNPNLVENFFSIVDSEEKAYFLGLIISDGNIFIDTKNTNIKRSASISITLSKDDKYMLENFKQILHTNTNISSDGRGCYQIAIRSNTIANDLEKYGVVPKKSFITFLPKIDKSLYKHLIRGILDGDGNITAHPTELGKFSHKIAFCGSNQLMEDLSTHLYEELKLSYKPKVYSYKDRLLSEFTIGNITDMKTVGNYLYNDATIFLQRKYNKYLNFLQHYKIIDNPEVTLKIAKGFKVP